MARISIIAAVAANRVIGARGALPWRLPADLKNFKRITLNHPVIMGRKTFDSIGRPLPERRNIVISRDSGLQIAGCEVVNALDAAIRAAREQNPNEVFIIGGAQIYAQAMPLAARLHLTEIRREAEGDVFFPRFSSAEWRETKRERGDNPSADESQIRFDFVLYERTRERS